MARAGATTAQTRGRRACKIQESSPGCNLKPCLSIIPCERRGHADLTCGLSNTGCGGRATANA
eukprot:252879-Rhodomonas_salina.1